jgi:hypothetical protein
MYVGVKKLCPIMSSVVISTIDMSTPPTNPPSSPTRT